MDQFYAGPITPTGHCNPSPLMHAGYGIQVNTQGRRFVPETWLQVPKAKAIAERTPDNRSFMLIGQDADANANILRTQSSVSPASASKSSRATRSKPSPKQPAFPKRTSSKR